MKQRRSSLLAAFLAPAPTAADEAVRLAQAASAVAGYPRIYSECGKCA